MQKFHSGTFIVGGTGSFTLRVTNVGGITATNHITVTDTLPFPLTLNGLPFGTGWDCSLSAGTQVNCQTDDDVNAGASLPDITVNVNIGQTILRTIVNEARVQSPGDINPNNDTDDDEIALQQVTRTAPVSSPLGAMLTVMLLLGLGLFGLRRAARRRV